MLKHLTLVNFELNKEPDETDVLSELTTLTLVNQKAIFDQFRTDTHLINGQKHDFVNVPRLVEAINFQFPQLNLLTVFGLVPNPLTVKQQLSENMEEKTLQLHLLNNPKKTVRTTARKSVGPYAPLHQLDPYSVRE